MSRALFLFCGTALLSAAAVNASPILSAEDVFAVSSFSYCLACGNSNNVSSAGSMGLGLSTFHDATANIVGDQYAGTTATASSSQANESQSATARLDYYFLVNGPSDQQQVNVLVSFNLEVNAAGGQGTQQFPASGLAVANILVKADAPASANLTCSSFSCSSDALHSGLHVAAQSGGVYEIDLTVSASGINGGSARAFADPLLTIDPSTPNAGQYSITVSPGVANALGPVGTDTATPEPGSLVLLGLGLLGVAGAGPLRRATQRG